MIIENRLPKPLLVVVPTLNEVLNIETLIGKLRQTKLVFDLLFVDDQSCDRTCDVIKADIGFEKNIFLIEREDNFGLGPAYLAAYNWALKHEYTMLMQLDADLSHGLEGLGEMIDKMNVCDAVIGSRYLKGSRVEGRSPIRLLCSLFAKATYQSFLLAELTDPFSGFKILNDRALKVLLEKKFFSRYFTFQAESSFYLKKANLRLEEVPVHFKEREVGKSKFHIKMVLESISVFNHLLLLNLLNIFKIK